jgi:hypothetical protein
VVLKEKIGVREFPDWSMGFRHVTPETPGANLFLDTEGHVVDHDIPASSARKLLTAFRDMK